MQSSADHTGFPLIAVPEAGIEMQLLPVAKVQFERFLAGPDGLGDIWYEAALAVHARVSWRSFSDEDRERLFLGGVLPAEGARFAAWMGRGFDLPTLAEWRAACRALPAEVLTSAKLAALRSHLGPVACAVLDRLLDQLQPSTLLGLSLMRGGLVEWVRDGRAFCGLGSPRPEFCPNVWDPFSDMVRPIRPADRLPYFGFRLVRRMR